MNKKLFRSRTEKMIAGVSGGLAKYFDIDVTLVRIIFIVSLFMGGTGILAYIILWIAVPEEPYQIQAQYSAATGSVNDPVSEKSNPSGDYSKQSSEFTFDPVVNYAEIIEERRKKRNFLLGVILILLGVLFLIGNIVPRIDFADLFPVVLLLIGIWLLTRSKKD
jgi:phage shock protein C